MDFKERKHFKSKKDEYLYGDWKKLKCDIFVTLETPIPSIPQILKAKPDEAIFNN